MHHPTFAQVDPAFADEAREIGVLVQAFGDAVEAAIRRHQRAIADREIVQERMADAAIELYHATAVLSRVTATLAARGDPAATQAEVTCARLFLRMARHRAEEHIQSIAQPMDALAPVVVDRAVDVMDVAPRLPDE